MSTKKTKKIQLLGGFPQSDWTQTDSKQVDYIKNKPENLSDFNNDVGYLTEEEFAEKLAEEPLIGTTEEITPTQVKEALQEGKAISLTHVDPTYGICDCNNFAFAHDFSAVLSSTIAAYGDKFLLIQLNGNTMSNKWVCNITQIATPTDIPTALPNPNALTINGTVYDGTESVDYTETIYNIIDGKLPTVKDGVTPEFSIGTVSTLDTGSNATATITGTAEKPILNLGIPKGAAGVNGKDGDKGDTGADGKTAYEYAQDGGYTGTEAEFSEKLATDFSAGQNFHYIIGNSVEAGIWTGTCENITEYYEGLTILYKTNIAGVSSGTTLNINEFGAVSVKRNASTAVTTTYPVGSVLMLTYSDGNWLTADYDANTKNTTGTSNKSDTKLFLAGATSQSSSATTYSNKNVYVGSDNCLYSNGEKVATSKEVEAIEPFKPSVKDYGAKGDGTTDDTDAFKDALAENRLVYVPEGTYVLSDTLVVRPNCEIELSQATHLKFTQTESNCIELRSSATLRGNHAVIEVPYAFTGNVVSADTQFDEGTRDTPPFAHYDPMWKRARYIYDVCIVKPNSAGLHCSIDGACSGTGIYLSAKGKHLTEGDINYIWGAMLQGVRIAGAFTYGINAINIDNPNDSTEDDAWNHDMRIEAVIQGCETGVSLTNCNTAHLAVTIQPSSADGSDTYRGTKYAKWGVYLNDCRNIDMTSSLVWDWHVARDDSEEYQHIAMYGNCRGLVLSDFLYHENSTDIRKLIYTDTPSNLDKMTILQEPITRWFKPIDNLPYFSDGNGDKQLLLKEDFDICFDTDNVADFTDELARATDGDGNIYNGVGYITNTGYYDGKWTTYTNGTYYFHTGFIPVKAGDVIYGKNLSFNKASDGNCRIVLFDSSYQFVNSISSGNLMAEYNYFCVYEGTNEDFKLTIRAVDIDGYEIPSNTAAAYIRFQMLSKAVGENPVIAVNEEIKYSQVGVLADSIKVKAENVLDLSIPTDKYINNLIDAKFNEIGIAEEGSY